MSLFVKQAKLRKCISSLKKILFFSNVQKIGEILAKI